MELIKTIAQLSAIAGVSGDEGAVREAIAARLAGICQLTTDPLGNLLAFKKGKTVPKNELLFSAHMDEVGFIITHIEDNGLLRFASCGGIDPRVIFGKRVAVGAAQIPGVIGAKALHLLEEKEKQTPAKADALLIDIGAVDKEQAASMIRLGDRAVFYTQFSEMGGGKLMGKALDDRAGCALLIHLAESDLPFDCSFSFTVQEETGCIGGITAAYQIAPAIAVAVETTTASDIAGVPPDKMVCKLGGGPVISFMDRGTVYDHALYNTAISLAEKCGIPAQTKQGIFGGNESRSLQTARNGAQVMAVSLPCRYLHSPCNMLDTKDIAATFALLNELIAELGNL